MKKQFGGQFNHSIDQKGRVIVPLTFREKLGASFVVTKGLDVCLWIFSEEEWDAFSEKLSGLPVSNKDARRFARFFLSGATEVTPDKQGRILLPQPLREYAHIEKDVTVAGDGNRVEIWDKQRFKDDEDFITGNIDNTAERMGEYGFEI